MERDVKPFDVKSPCDESWSAMTPTPGGRHCATCDKRVFDLASMTEAEVRGLVSLTSGRFCGRQVIRGGALVTRFEAPRPAAPSRGLFALRVVTRGAIVAGALASAACGEASAEPSTPLPVLVAQVFDPTPETPFVGPEIVEPPEIMLAGEIAPLPPEVHDKIYFEAGRSKLDKKDTQVLDGVAAVLEHSWFSGVRIVGHVDAAEAATPRKIEALALARAQAVKAWLVKHGVDPQRVEVVARGVSGQPAAATEAAHAENRHVSFEVF